MDSNDTVPIAPANPYYEIRATPTKGYGCFALQLLKRGTRIMADDPLLIIPIAHYMQSDVEAAYSKLTPAQQAMYFMLYSNHNQDPKNWPSRIHESVTEHERQRITEQHNARVATSPSLISIFQTNCMDMDKGAAVFPHAARLNHSCNPNACFNWNPEIGKETIHIMNDVRPNDEITISYVDMIHDRTMRAWELKHYGFTCDCPACSNPTTSDVEDDESSFAHQSAIRRYRLSDIERETRFLRGKYLAHGLQQPDFVKKLLEMAALHQAEGEWSARLASVFLDIAIVCEELEDVRMGLLTARKALGVKRDCQGMDVEDYAKFEEVVKRLEGKLGEQRG